MTHARPSGTMARYRGRIRRRRTRGGYPPPEFRHGPYWRNRYGRYYHGVWISLRDECLGCFLWFLIVVAVCWFLLHLAVEKLNS